MAGVRTAFGRCWRARGWHDGAVPAADRRRRLTAPFRLRNYRAVVGSLRAYENPVDGLSRYVRGTGEYPWTTTLRTPIGPVELLVPHPHDVRTVNEVFCRHDYGGGTPRVVVDVGANIGVSALYFLTRRPDAVVHAWEPLASNLGTLRRNLAPFAGRAHLHERALAPEAGPATFLAEPVGRYSGLAEWSATADDRTRIEVQCDAVVGTDGRAGLWGAATQERRKCDVEGGDNHPRHTPGR
jgi:FkbM family methyltransferase